MTIGNKFRLLTVSSLILIAGLIVTIILTSWNQSALNLSAEIRYDSRILANELRQSSDDLTSLARTYVVTGDPKYEAEYWHVLAVRNGQKPRADGRTVPLRKLMEELGFTSEEFSMLKQAEDNSNALVRTETIAMNAVKGLFDDGTGAFTKRAAPDLELARRIMHDDQYHRDKAIIMQPISQFEVLLDQRTKAAVDKYAFRGNVGLWVIAIAVLGLGTTVILSVRSVNGVLRSAVQDLDAGADQIAGAASQVAASAQAVAQNASEQAASLEETSAAGAEIDAMTRNNAENTRVAVAMSSNTGQKVAEANQSLKEMVTAMEEVSTSSAKISGIIKVIDNIAFQTNILALNAAVEAARAGDSGLGFAVVADEVRTLAQRCAEAAKDTASLIEDSIAKADSGKAKVGQAAAAMQVISEDTGQVNLLIAEVNVASQEQARGIAQVAKAISEMQHVTQETAASAEEGASAAEELNAQSEALKGVVKRLTAMVGGREAVGGSRAGFGRERAAATHRGCGLSALRTAASHKTNDTVRLVARAKLDGDECLKPKTDLSRDNSADSRS